MTKPVRDNIIPFPGRRQVSRILRFRIDLVMMPYPTWRQIEVPEDYTFWDLHVAIQDAMGWQDRHLHLFTVDHPQRGDRSYFGIPDHHAFHGAGEIVAGWEQPVAEFFRPDCPPALYTYDLGDEWQHEVALEWSGRADPDGSYPRCLAGAGACPPEDSGGAGFFAQRLAEQVSDDGDASADVGDHDDDESYRHFDRDRFDPAQVIFDDPQRRWQRAFGRQ